MINNIELMFLGFWSWGLIYIPNDYLIKKEVASRFLLTI